MIKLRIPPITLLVIFFSAYIFALLAIYVPDLIRNEFISISPNFVTNITAAFMGFSGLATLFLGYMIFEMIIANRKKEENDRKDGLLNEIIDCVIEIRMASLVPIISDNLENRETNIELRYGIVLAKIIYFRDAAIQILGNITLHKKASEVANSLVAVMVLTRAKNNNTEVTEESFKAFIGFDDIKMKILSECEKHEDIPKLCELYTLELNGFESDLLDEINNIKKSL
ncbi:hypothetical protein ACFLX0_01590 [Chloroflexota bacterium]